MNQSIVERFVRILVGGAFMITTNYVTFSPWICWPLSFIGLLLILTGLSGFSPIYSILKIGKKEKTNP